MTRPDTRVDELATVTDQLADCEDETEVAWTIVESIDTVIEFDAAVVYERVDDRLRPLATAADKLHPAPALSAEAGVAGRVLQDGDARITDNLTTAETERDPGAFRTALTAPIDDDRGLQLLSTNREAYGSIALSTVRVVCTQAQCVLERVATQSRARREADEFAALFDNVPDPTLRYEVRDDTPVVDEVNAALLSTFDRTVESVVGARLDTVVGERTDDSTTTSRDPDDSAGRRQPPELTAARNGERTERRVDRPTVNGTRRFLVRTVPGQPDVPTYTGTGYVIYVDVEASRRREQLAVLTRFLRHNVRNDISVLRAYLEQIRQVADSPNVADYAAAAMATADKLSRRSQKARTAQELVDGTEAKRQTGFDLGRVASERVTAARQAFGAVELTTAIPANPPTVTAHDRLPLAVGEVLENAATHAGDTPTVTVTVDTTETAGVITVADDGPGIPQRETRVIDRGEENQLEHGRGIGLWLVSWVVNASDGALYVTRPDDGGTVVRLSLPLAEGAAADGTTSR